MRSIDIELKSECGSCLVAIKGDHNAIKCPICYYIVHGISLSPELQECQDLLDKKNKIKVTTLADCM